MQNIFQAISAIMSEIEAIGKNKKNVQQGYAFRGIDDMYNAIQPLFKKHQVFITSNILGSKREERLTAKGNALIYTITKCQFRFYTVDGSFVESIIEGEAMDSGDKSTNKAMSAALKYALIQMFLIPTESNIDTENETHEIKPKTVKEKEKIAEAEIDEDFNEVEKLCRMKYTTPGDLLLVLDSVETIGQIRSLYQFNSQLVDTDTKVKNQFKIKKDAIKSKAA
jgi:hypothetical protein